MKNIPIAQKKEYTEESPQKGRFIIEPFYPGYGLTIGNAIRRVLLSSLEGVAITSIRIKGVQHEFSTLTGVKEDVVDIILNLKQVCIKHEGPIDEPIKLELSVKGEKEVKAGDFKKVSGVEIVNPDLHLATITDSSGEFILEAWIERGRGYLPTEQMQTKEKEIGVIAIDAIFTPIKKVSVDNENVRVGDMTNWDRLILNLETDGTITPPEALKKAADILVEQFSFFLSDKEVESEEKEDKDNKKKKNTEDAEKEAGDAEEEKK